MRAHQDESKVSSTHAAQDIFHYFYQDGILEAIDIDSLSEDALVYFEFKSGQCIEDRDCWEGNFERTFLLHHPHHAKTYLATQTKTYTATTGYIGKRRFLVMNALTQTSFGLPLYSDVNNPETEGI